MERERTAVNLFRTKGGVWNDVEPEDRKVEVCTTKGKQRCKTTNFLPTRSFQVNNVQKDLNDRVNFPSFDFWDEDVCRQYMALFLNADGQLESPTQYEPYAHGIVCTIQVPFSCAVKYGERRASEPENFKTIQIQSANLNCYPKGETNFKIIRVRMNQSVCVFGLKLTNYENFSYFKIMKHGAGFRLCSSDLTSDFKPV